MSGQIDSRQMQALLEDVPGRIDTERLILRCADAADAAALNEAICESLSTPQGTIPLPEQLPSLAQSHAECRRMQANFLLREELLMLMFQRGSDGAEGMLLGSVGLHHIDWALRRFELGYWCRLSRQRMGFVTEAAGAMTQWAIDMLRASRVEARVDDAHVRSQQVAERAGLTLEGVLRNNTVDTVGCFRDVRIYALAAARIAKDPGDSGLCASRPSQRGQAGCKDHGHADPALHRRDPGHAARDRNGIRQ